MKYVILLILSVLILSCGKDNDGTVKETVCGNGVVETNEECDYKNDTNCSNECTIIKKNDAVCGNGILELGEECDPVLSTDCNDDCKVEVQKAVCGNGKVEVGEKCDYKNDTDCDTDCTWKVEPPTEGSHIESINPPFAPPTRTNGPGSCSGGNSRDTIILNVCILRFLNLAGEGYTASAAANTISGLQSVHEYLNTGLKFDIIKNIAFKTSERKYTDPTTNAQLEDAMAKVKSELLDRKCDLYVGYNNSLRVSNSALSAGTNAAGFSTLPWHSRRLVHTTIFRSTSNATMTHEFGHLLGLMHTFDNYSEQDFCSDTSFDGYSVSEKNRCNGLGKINYSGEGNCNDFANCTNGSGVRKNIMSYYGCKTTLDSENLTDQQINRMRCYIGRMNLGHEEVATCPSGVDGLYCSDNDLYNCTAGNITLKESCTYGCKDTGIDIRCKYSNECQNECSKEGELGCDGKKVTICNYNNGCYLKEVKNVCGNGFTCSDGGCVKDSNGAGNECTGDPSTDSCNCPSSFTSSYSSSFIFIFLLFFVFIVRKKEYK